MFLLDTNVVSELRKLPSGRANPGVVDVGGVGIFSRNVPLGDLCAELELGVLFAERSDPAKGRVLRAWLSDTVLPAFEGRILAVDESVAIIAATFHVPNPAPYRNAFIGATAMVHEGRVGATMDAACVARVNRACTQSIT